MDVKESPLISCVMPTYNRRKFVPHAIEYFLRQDYSNKELIIVDDGTDTVEDIVPGIPCIRYFRLGKKITLGAKLNLACDYARGEIIANWDDDDWYAKTRLTYQANALENEQIEVCGINNLLYYDLKNKAGYRYVYPADQRTWLLGSSLCYKKRLWNRNRFADIDVGMDGLFVWATSSHCVKVLPDSAMSVHMIHEHNVSPKKTNTKWWHSYPVDELQKIMQADWAVYTNENASANKNVILKPAAINSSIPYNNEPLKNIYACLVHESEECIIDLVRNLHYHDPGSVILLYNGGDNGGLLKNQFPYNKFGAVVYPEPVPVKHGWLHPFALNCMRFALENFSFDTFTIVDSDQLAIRPGYSEYVSKFFFSQPGVGMFSSNPCRVNKNDAVNRVAVQAYEEYDLWKPLLDSFSYTENNFVYWTFWPSTVFTYNAIKDLHELFTKNELLQNIMKHTKIWATEEVIFPTLVKLLGYEITANPCSYEFVKYRKIYTPEDINCALRKPDAYWIHPVERKLHDPLRKYIRDRSNEYLKNHKDNMQKGSFFITSLLKKVKNIQGWLSDKEAELLISITDKACEDASQRHNIVEIGSYHGKSTVLFGSLIKHFFPGSKLYAIDIHDGKLGTADHLQVFPPSFEMFKKNIEAAELCDVIEIIKDNAYNVQWQSSISLLFIDGLHDYLNVSRDFQHFSDWIRQGRYVAFHDYANYFPGVKKFVDELLKTGTFKKTGLADSLVVLQKS